MLNLKGQSDKKSKKYNWYYTKLPYPGIGNSYYFYDDTD